MKRHMLRSFSILCAFGALLFFSCVSEKKTDQPVAAEIIDDSQQNATVPAEPQEFVVTEELYQETFEDIESLIAKINSAVIKQDYDSWLKYLTEDYISFWSNVDNLTKVSNDLQKSTGYKIRLRTLKDYFKYVVVNSRIDIKLDKIEFIDENRITAESIINDTPYILYYLEKIDNEWKIGKW